jgi:hypothetical protein
MVTSLLRTMIALWLTLLLLLLLLLLLRAQQQQVAARVDRTVL